MKTYSVTVVTSVPWDTERVLRLDKDAYGKKPFFLPEVIQSRSETALLVRAVVKNEPMGRQRSCTNLWWRFPPDPARSCQNGRGIWLYKRSFRHRILRLLRLKRRLSRAATWHGKVRSTRSVSQGTGYDSNRVRSLSILHSYCVLIKHMGTEFNHAVLG